VEQVVPELQEILEPVQTPVILVIQVATVLVVIQVLEEVPVVLEE
jgi:hypothetical protein